MRYVAHVKETIGMTIDSGDTVTNTEFEISAYERAVYEYAGVLGKVQCTTVG